MKISLVVFFPCLLFCSCTYKVYVVRHAEKSAAPADNPLLSDAGTERALSLRETLKNKKIRHIYSTNTTRTQNTVAPLAEVLHIKTVNYAARPDSNFIKTLKSNASNQLVVGHSNTIDDVVNMLVGNKAIPDDLPDAAYDNLYIVKLPKSGKGHGRLESRKYGKKSQSLNTAATPAMSQH
jgi:broad specificity phosphatase PhoE